jgi:hypothetical protein
VTMTGRRHLGRLSSRTIPSQASLYDAMQAIIGAGLKERYEVPQRVPPDMLRLLTELDEESTGRTSDNTGKLSPLTE